MGKEAALKMLMLVAELLKHFFAVVLLVLTSKLGADSSGDLRLFIPCQIGGYKELQHLR